jgi:hypothetical protein
MKKILMTLAAAFVAANMSAQYYVGGGVTFRTGTTTNEVTTAGIKTSTDLKSNGFSIVPEIGMKLDDKMAIGVALGYANSKSESNPTTTFKINEFEIAPYFRYTLASWGNLSLFTDAQFRVLTGKETTETTGAADVETKLNEWGLFIIPGISYQLNDKFNFVAKLGSGLGYANTKRENESTNVVRKTSALGLSANSLGLTFGMYYNF